MPGARTKVALSDGRFDPAWIRFFVDLHERTGGAKEDKIEIAATRLTDASDRLDFEIDFDIR